MTTLQLRKLKMYLALRVLLNANPDILAKLPNAEEYLTALDAAILNIQNYSAMQQEGNEEILNQKKKLKAQLIAGLIETGRKLQAYATYKKDDALLNSLKLSESYLIRLDDIELIEYAKIIHKKANEHFDLIPYGVTPETQTALLVDITQFETLSPQIPKAKQDQKNLTSTLNENYKIVDETLISLDKLVEIVHSTAPKFYADYKAMRKVEVPTDVMQLVAKVTDAGTGAGIPNATVTLTLNSSSNDPIVRQTAEKGGFQIKSLPNGIYTVTVVKIGYQTQTLTITLPGDEPYDLVVKMVKG
jgi:hypothetical protein